MFDTIVLPTDGSDHAEVAAETGIELATAHDAAVHVVSVADTGLLGGLRLPGEAASAEDAMRGRAQESVDAVVEAAEAAGLEPTGAVLDGPPAEAILEYARDVDADLIVMGTRGRGGVHRMAMGSVTDHVVRFGDVPVFVANSESSVE
ncbi:UspA domain-containing protein [Natrinema pellirubrum DSM 15624]|uniref:Universal stress protein UspA-like protein n=2 Tax=Natrinema TaxID=88723 RepID=L0JGY3_NATP1|nr:MULTISPECIES: universal stress protein [Natrinema]ELZ18831.1 UspA domain-containing protein [Natrinema thermotolerans DSM 11552]AGB30574.1 universal stress protein UspA-like protein [Natrinema pellirubrum DSM 15624]ELY74951.1 UspA domain-containing protein [Natrinema pellirubrum DSM 15624]QCC59397.1 universal stress protein [Natrinema thermotolerans]WMT06368.1 universal stress protein [Natrinema thermotolerans]